MDYTKEKELYVLLLIKIQQKVMDLTKKRDQQRNDHHRITTDMTRQYKATQVFYF